MIKPLKIQIDDDNILELRNNVLSRTPKMRISWGHGDCNRELDMKAVAALRNYCSAWLTSSRGRIESNLQKGDKDGGETR